MHINYPSITQFQQLVELKDYRKPTKKEYVRYVRKLAEHFQCDPATLTENQLREYFLFLRQHKHYSRSPMKIAKYALLCFYVECLKVTDWTVFREVRIAEPQVLPMVLSRAEVQAVLGAVREPRFRTCLRLMYHCGLRVGETVRIEVKDIHGREKPPRLHIRCGKGGKYGKVVIMERCSSKTLQRQRAAQPELSITRGCRGSEGPRRLAETGSWQFVAGGPLLVPAFSSPSWLRHRGGWF